MSKYNEDAATVHEVSKFCWLCGRTQSYRPIWFHGPYYLQIAHIASGGGRAFRVNDRRAVGLLCTICHHLHVSDADRLPTMQVGKHKYPTIDERHTLYLKKAFDPEHYDPEWLASIWIGNVPKPAPPHEFWRKSMLKHTGIALH